MAQLKFFKVSVLPSTFEGDSFYYVANGTYAESYLTNSAGVPKSVGNSSMINALIQSALADFKAQGNTVEIVANIAARNTLTTGSQKNLMVLVIDATGDPTVASGSALYAYAHDSTTTYKVAEYESMDVTLDWSKIIGRPTSSVTQIDNAVSLAHSHANKVVLDKISDVGGALNYNGAPVTTDWTTNNW